MKQRYSDYIALCLIVSSPFVFMAVYLHHWFPLIFVAICLIMAGINARALESE
jgi:hypothetical protein